MLKALLQINHANELQEQLFKILHTQNPSFDEWRKTLSLVVYLYDPGEKRIYIFCLSETRFESIKQD